MKRQLNRPRLFISAWYIGAGSLVSVFTAKPNQAFSKLKSIYGSEMEKYTTRKDQQSVKQIPLTEAERQRIKLNVKQELRARTIKILILLSITLLLFLLVIFSALKLANYILNNR